MLRHKLNNMKRTCVKAGIFIKKYGSFHVEKNYINIQFMSQSYYIIFIIKNPVFFIFSAKNSRQKSILSKDQKKFFPKCFVYL